MSILNLVRELLTELIKLVRDINSEPTENKSQFRGDIMYIVKADNPEVGYNLSFTVKDSEGNDVPDANLTVTVASDNEAAVAISADETGRAGTVSFGSPGLANVNVTVEDSDGDLLGSFGAQFTVTVGDPAAIAGGTLVFEGLSEAPTDTTEPTEPETPVEPAPTEPEVPTEPETPVEPAPTEPTEPTEPEVPTEPETPVEPAPTEPTEPEVPTEPETPVEPEPTEPFTTRRRRF